MRCNGLDKKGLLIFFKAAGPPPSNIAASAYPPEDEEDIDDKIDEWHNSDSELSIHEHLGMTWEEYAAFVEGK